MEPFLVIRFAKSQVANLFYEELMLLKKILRVGRQILH